MGNNDIGQTGGYEDSPFKGKSLEEMSAIVDADYAQVPTWRKQAKAYRALVELAGRHRDGISEHMKDAGYAWSSPGTKGLRLEHDDFDDSIRRGLDSASGSAEALDRIADAVEEAKSKVDAVRNEWLGLEAQRQKNPHIFDGYTASGVPAYQAAKESYAEQARRHMDGMATEANHAWYASMHEPGAYKGPVYARTPERAVTPVQGSGSNGGGSPYDFSESTGDGGYGGPSYGGGTPGSGAPVTGPSGVGTRPDVPRTEFPTPVVTPPVATSPGGMPPVIGGPGTVPSVGGFPPGVVPPVAPGMFPTGPGVFGPQRMGPGGPGMPGGYGVGGGGGRTSPSVIGRRPGTAERPEARGAVRPTAENGVIRNPRSRGAVSEAVPGSRNGSKRREDRENALYADGGETDELFEGLDLDVVPEVIRPEEPTRVRRRDAGPALRG